ncbi:helix-turn-helix transcriptional regulator [Virgibacillus salexigens]|uniref:HTH cro/C1-type domain-containing protein n=1 Tax=Virgibacillus kapii TaxID=1638645 RepID=A0ABQ2D8I8_9BACI|nr:helix-turn-helix transcriptional regulator [Virgibacillus kapii]GGJ49682.1 hypothetical protein GCM10007111_09760 [Virgibacillus kapii]
MTNTQLKLIRLYLGLTQKDFATYVNVAESTIAKIEAGFTGVSEVTKARVYRKFDVTENNSEITRRNNRCTRTYIRIHARN